ncbi:hypothetical protein GH714_010486 [Hevea brasiliensis]|uniref:CCHC-type domain-containing protein n=1 Tax=Hevea brasiliensis TaxID=3981 RepID=A0A6A6N048_HEVBR|nr:hypothetical protein GH714_010486 [Hevea brasiliensis]
MQLQQGLGALSRGRIGGIRGCRFYDSTSRGGNGYNQQPRSTDKGENRSQIQCYYCGKYGHIERFCRLKEKQANIAQEKEEDETESLFLACFSAKECPPAGCIDDRKSTTGYAFNLGSGVICWNSKKQPSTALSSLEAEYMGIPRKFVRRYGSDLSSPAVLKVPSGEKWKFNVIIIDKSALEIDYPFSISNRDNGEPNLEQEFPGPKIDENENDDLIWDNQGMSNEKKTLDGAVARRKPLTAEEKANALRRASTSLKSGNPYFMVAMPPSFLYSLISFRLKFETFITVKIIFF